MVGRGNTLHLFTRRHQVLVGFEDVSEGFFDVLLLHARQHGWRQEQRQTPLLPADPRPVRIIGGHSVATINSQVITRDH